MEISVDDVLHAQIEFHIRSEYDTKQKKDQEAIALKEAEIAKRFAELDEAKRNSEIEISNAVKKQLAQKELELQKQAKLDAESEQKVILDSLKNQLTEKTNMLTKAREEQVQLMDEKQKIKDEKEAFEIEKRKQLDDEREKIIEDAKKKASEEQANILAQKDKQIQDALKAKDELARKLEQGSQQTQGEVVEIQIEEALKSEFIYDEISPVPKGVCGADIIQRVKNPAGQVIGQIIWEVKQTKTWGKDWIEKVKDDQRAIHADMAVIASSVIPEDIINFGYKDGVWICESKFAVSLATAIRLTLESVSKEKNLAVGKDEKKEVLYQYITGVQFKQRVEAIAGTIKSMQDDMIAEKKHFTKKWAKAEKQIERVVTNMFGMYGDLSGMAALPQIPTLELEFDDTVE